jgi:hypothetical protein
MAATFLTTGGKADICAEQLYSQGHRIGVVFYCSVVIYFDGATTEKVLIMVMVA